MKKLAKNLQAGDVMLTAATGETTVEAVESAHAHCIDVTTTTGARLRLDPDYVVALDRRAVAR
jgi:hypothetical protein